MTDNYQAVIGLEVHVELLTGSKMFCSCSTAFGTGENTQVCPVCLGMPGVLPFLNYRAIQLGIKTGLAFDCDIPGESVFVRKSYFYPDLPKNFQTSQYQQPLAAGGHLDIGDRKIRIKRIHLEEDTGKLLHNDGYSNHSLIDFNRSGIPLMEIVTEPDISSPEEAEQFLLGLKKILQYIAVSDCNMEEGSLRCDANVSIKKDTDAVLGTKVEVKNMNSFKSVKKALRFEIERQSKLLVSNKPLVQETRQWDEKLEQTETMRTKEEAHDYRYFPEPDLLPVRMARETIKKIEDEIGELPPERKSRFMSSYGLSEYDAGVLTSERELADYFEETLKFHGSARTVSAWIQTVLLGMLKAQNLTVAECPVRPAGFTELLKLVDSGKITPSVGKQILAEMFESGKDPSVIASEKNLLSIEDGSVLEKLVVTVISDNLKAVEDFRAGKEQSMGFLIGMVMKKSAGKSDPKKVREILEKHLMNKTGK